MKTIASKQERKVLSVSALKDHPKNPNKHPASQIEALAKSIEQYGQYYPIIVDEDYTILCGHGKKYALIKLGQKEADVLVMHGLSEKQKLKLLAEDNKIQNLSMVDFSMIIGFNPQYIDSIIGDVSVDNMGVDMEQKAEQPKQQAVRSQSDKPAVYNTPAKDDFSAGCANARTIKCPHCGKEVTL